MKRAILKALDRFDTWFPNPLTRRLIVLLMPPIVPCTLHGTHGQVYSVPKDRWTCVSCMVSEWAAELKRELYRYDLADAAYEYDKEKGRGRGYH